jgi:hypothetical protein
MAPLHVAVDQGMVERQSCGASVNDTAQSRSVRLAEAGQPETGAYAIAHGSGAI